jgi:hypothetical protein
LPFSKTRFFVTLDCFDFESDAWITGKPGAP